MKVWVQKWEETERGWGTRPDGYTIHKSKSDIKKFEQQLRAQEMSDKPKGFVPDEYSRPCGQPYLTELSDKKEIKHLNMSECGVWGIHRNNYPKPFEPNIDKSGWVSLDKDSKRKCVRCDQPKSQHVEVESLGLICPATITTFK